MRKLILWFCVAAAVTMVGGAAAQAATTSVNGTGSYQKLVVNNAAKNLSSRSTRRVARVPSSTCP